MRGRRNPSPHIAFLCAFRSPSYKRPLQKASVDARLVARSFRKPCFHWELGSTAQACHKARHTLCVCVMWCSALAAALDTSLPCVCVYVLTPDCVRVALSSAPDFTAHKEAAAVAWATGSAPDFTALYEKS